MVSPRAAPALAGDFSFYDLSLPTEKSHRQVLRPMSWDIDPIPSLHMPPAD